jgi:hypothetical protein
VRKIVVHMQSTLDNRIANAQGTFWQPFPWGDPEMAYINQSFRAADTFALSRVLYDAIIPWWDGVATGQLPPDAPEIPPGLRRVRPDPAPDDQGRVLQHHGAE